MHMLQLSDYPHMCPSVIQLSSSVSVTVVFQCSSRLPQNTSEDNQRDLIKVSLSKETILGQACPSFVQLGESIC